MKVLNVKFKTKSEISKFIRYKNYTIILEMFKYFDEKHDVFHDLL